VIPFPSLWEQIKGSLCKDFAELVKRLRYDITEGLLVRILREGFREALRHRAGCADEFQWVVQVQGGDEDSIFGFNPPPPHHHLRSRPGRVSLPGLSGSLK
jgi:hypothetical protein